MTIPVSALGEWHTYAHRHEMYLAANIAGLSRASMSECSSTQWDSPTPKRGFNAGCPELFGQTLAMESSESGLGFTAMWNCFQTTPYAQGRTVAIPSTLLAIICFSAAVVLFASSDDAEVELAGDLKKH